jgi:hypothetical protein
VSLATTRTLTVEISATITIGACSDCRLFNSPHGLANQEKIRKQTGVRDNYLVVNCNYNSLRHVRYIKQSQAN